MKKFCLILLTLLGAITVAFPQKRHSEIDSLGSLLKTTQKPDTNRVKLLNELSGYLILADRYDSAIFVSNQALALSEQLDYPAGIASAYRKSGVAYIQIGSYPLALDLLLKSMRINEELKNKEEIFKLNNNIGNLHYSQGSYDKALTYFAKAFAYKKNDAFTNSNIGITYLAQEKYRQALFFMEKALAYYSYKNDETGVSDMMTNIGTIYEYRGSYDQALEYYFQSLKIKEEINHLKGQADNLASIGDVYIRKGDYKSGLIYELTSLDIAKQIDYLISMQETYNKISQIYYSMGDTGKSFEFYKKYVLIKDSLYNKIEYEKTIRSQMNFDFDKKQSIDKILHEEEIKHQTTQRNIFILGFILILVFSIFLFRSFKKTKKQNYIIEEQKKLVEHKTKELTDNIHYAAKIQQAVLPSEEYMKNNLPDYFLISRARDIVNGDFYWVYRDGENIYFATADCTSHGSSAALLTMIGASLLNEIVIERKITRPDLVLNTLREEVIRALNKSGALEERKEGMDLVFCKLTGMKLEAACANNSIYIIRNNELIQIRADRSPIGKYILDPAPFKLNTIELQKSDLIYTFSDGFQDQFGGPKNRKLMSKQFKEWAIELSNLELSEIKCELENRLNKWIGNGEQTDDITVFTIRV